MKFKPWVVCLEVGGVVFLLEKMLLICCVFATRLMSCLTAFHSTNPSLFMLAVRMFCLLFAQFC